MSPRTVRARALTVPPVEAVPPPGAPHTLGTAPAQRVMVLWCPDWPVTAARRSEGLGADAPLALIDRGRVFASSAAARAEGVTRGLRLREAQSRCTSLVVLDHDPALEHRAFEPLLTGLEQLTPAVQVLRPGLCAVRARGPARYYGGEHAAALALAARLDELGGGGVRVGIADGSFTAEQAARRAHPVGIVTEGGSAGYLAPLPVTLLGDETLVTLLRRLGIHTLGQFARLDAADVQSRFGPDGARLHALAAGRDSWPVTPRVPPSDLDEAVDFEPPLDRVDQVAFGVRQAAERFVERLAARRLVCTGLRVELHADDGGFAERAWLHPRSFSPADVVDRVRWQLQALELRAPVVRVRILPDTVDAIGSHEAGLWGTGTDERVHHALSRVQSMLGHGGVLAPGVGGGRTLADRQRLTAWGDRPVDGRPAAQPWPGRLPPPLPGTVFSPRRPVQVLDRRGEPVTVDARGEAGAPPAALRAGGRALRLSAWAGPWPLDERWWSRGADAGVSWRFQAVDETGCGWLLVLDADGWWAEARYD